MTAPVALQVAFVPGRYFSPRGKDPAYKCRFARLAYSFLPPDMFEEGARRVARVLDAYAAQKSSATAAKTPPSAASAS
jgi:DNA-binding transcriptional MocR family regulator